MVDSSSASIASSVSMSAVTPGPEQTETIEPPKTKQTRSSSADGRLGDLQSLSADRRGSRSDPSEANAAVPNPARARAQERLLRLANKAIEPKGMAITAAKIAEVRSARAQKALAELQREIPAMVRRERAAYFSSIVEKLDSGTYSLPTVFAGTAACGEDGKLASRDDTAVNALLHLANELYPERAKAVAARLNAGGCKVRLPLENGIFSKITLFDEGCKVRGLHTKDGEVKEVEIGMVDFALRQAIKKGRAGFTEEADLNAQWRQRLEAMEERDAASRPPSAEAIELEEQGGGTANDSGRVGDDRKIHPFDFLKDVRYVPETDDPELTALLTDCMNSYHPAVLDMRGKLGALGISSVINNKQFNKKLAIAIVASLVAAGGAAYVLDQWVWNSLSKLARGAGQDGLAEAIDVVGPAMTALFSEGLDNLCLGRFIGTLDDEPLLWESKEDFFDDVQQSAKAGSVAVGGQLLQNAAGEIPGWGGFAAQALTTPVVAATSAALIPGNVRQRHMEVAAGALEGYRSRFYAPPQLPEGTDPEETEKSLQAHATSEAGAVIEAERSTQLQIAAMGKGQWFSQVVGFLPIEIASRMNLINQLWQKMASIAANTPTEMYNISLGIVTDSKLPTTDTQKTRQRFALVVDHAIKRIKSGTNEPSEPISEATLAKIEHPGSLLTSTFHQGKAIVDGMNQAVDFFVKGWTAITKKERELSLVQQVGTDDIPTSAHERLPQGV